MLFRSGLGTINMNFGIWSVTLIISVAWITFQFKVHTLGVQASGHRAVDHLAESHVCLVAALRMEVSPTARAPYLLRASPSVIDRCAMRLPTLVLLFEMVLKLILPHQHPACWNLAFVKLVSAWHCVSEAAVLSLKRPV